MHSLSSPLPLPVMVIDGEPEHLAALLRVLYKVGLQRPIVAFRNATDAIQHLLRAGVDHPALVITEGMMPGMSGFDFLKWIRAHAEMSQTPVIVISEPARGEERSQSLAMGADGYLTRFPSANQLAGVLAGKCARLFH